VKAQSGSSSGVLTYSCSLCTKADQICVVQGSSDCTAHLLLSIALSNVFLYGFTQPVSLWNASAHLFFCLLPCLHSQPQQNLSHMPAFIMIISDRDSPSRTRLMQHHACVRSAAWPRIHQFYNAKIDWPSCIKYWSEENLNEPVWLQPCCPCGQICGQIRAFSDAEDQSKQCLQASGLAYDWLR